MVGVFDGFRILQSKCRLRPPRPAKAGAYKFGYTGRSVYRLPGAGVPGTEHSKFQLSPT